MNFKLLSLTAALMAFGAAPALAGTVTIDALPYYGGVPAGGASSDYVSLWNSLLAEYPSQPSGYLDQTISNWNGSISNSAGGGVNSNLAYLDTTTFTVYAGDAGLWNFRAGVDFGYGGTLIVNGQALQTTNSDMWWANSFANASSVLQGSLYLSPGTYTLAIYGAENCCDGGTQAQYLAPGQTVYRDFTTGIGTAVPEVSTWAMMLAGFAAIGCAGYHRRATKSEAALAA